MTMTKIKLEELRVVTMHAPCALCGERTVQVERWFNGDEETFTLHHECKGFDGAVCYTHIDGPTEDSVCKTWCRAGIKSEVRSLTKPSLPHARIRGHHVEEG